MPNSSGSRTTTSYGDANFWRLGSILSTFFLPRTAAAVGVYLAKSEPETVQTVVPDYRQEKTREAPCGTVPRGSG